MRITSFIALVLVIIGALNWLLVGLFAFDLVAFIAGGATTVLARLIYVLVGIAGLWTIFYLAMYNPLRRLH